ncbi:GntR family transcriptional regulator [Acetobacter farinalis]|uniref:GntR family transcriptional regulator n=1 Tax=Acetobacter farinalis TaxID=1260984 RepID=A0ABT3Q7Y3_9PROT|nr:GntR family transcriptional regulator [Acetobacter farinalis]MCX2561362.1 GntR family transcriptional regulator [Acetobacter farinalis]NHO30474.1 GntR family transcriptional regulator [Acetobacter farinalis]
MTLSSLPEEGASSSRIEDRIVYAALSGQIAPGERLGEKELAEIFGVSRTLVREAMMRLQARGIVQVSSRRGWFVIEPTEEEARHTLDARRALEVGMLVTLGKGDARTIQALRAHVQAEKAAIRKADRAERSYLLGHFHVCLAETLGSPVLAALLQDLTTRTVLIAALYQSSHDACESSAEHEVIIDALEAGDVPEAARLMDKHLRHVENALNERHVLKRLKNLKAALNSSD